MTFDFCPRSSSVTDRFYDVQGILALWLQLMFDAPAQTTSVSTCSHLFNLSCPLFLHFSPICCDLFFIDPYHLSSSYLLFSLWRVDAETLRNKTMWSAVWFHFMSLHSFTVFRNSHVHNINGMHWYMSCLQDLSVFGSSGHLFSRWFCPQLHFLKSILSPFILQILLFHLLHPLNSRVYGFSIWQHLLRFLITPLFVSLISTTTHSLNVIIFTSYSSSFPEMPWFAPLIKFPACLHVKICSFPFQT